MSIPNTTPTPNELYNGEMHKMKDTELRIVLIVTRATLGWVVDKETGMRKKEDWTASKQLMEKSGRKNKAVSLAIANCVKNGWIEARDKEGNLLSKPEDRARRKKIFYRLGKVFLDKISTGVEKTSDEEANSLVSKRHLTGVKRTSGLVCKVHPTKETPTKETLQKKNSSSKMKPYFRGEEMRKTQNKWWVIPQDGGEWLEFAGQEADIDWLKKS